MNEVLQEQGVAEQVMELFFFRLFLCIASFNVPWILVACSCGIFEGGDARHIVHPGNY